MSAESQTDRRAFLKSSAAAGAVLAAGSARAMAQGIAGDAALTKGDIAILRFLAATETIEADLWLQYAELGGTQDHQLPGLPTGGNPAYTAALNNLDGDMAQYIHDNTDDEFSHWFFLDAYLEAKGADKVDLDQFRTLPSSQATGANKNVSRLTNLMQLTVDTSWWGRYRTSNANPDLDPNFKFAQAVPSLLNGQFPAIPRTDADLTPQGHLQCIANTAAFHFAFIEQGGTSLYPILAQQVTSDEVLRVLLSIGGTEIAHFQTWHDKAGNAVQPPLAPLTDPTNTALTFPNVNARPRNQDLHANLIMPEPCPFLSRRLPRVSIIRPTLTANGGAVATVNAFTADGLFRGQTTEFFEFYMDLARAADAAKRNRVT